MAVQIESQGQLQEFLEILKRRKWQVILPAGVIIALGAALAVIVPKKFVARTQVELRPVGVSISSKEGANAPFQLRANTRVRKVVQSLQNREFLSLPPDKQTEFIDDTAASIKVTIAAGASQGATFVNIEYANVSKDWAENFLRALRDDWITDVLERDIHKAEDEQQQLLQERNKLEKEYQHEEALLTDLLRDHNLSPTQPSPGGSAARGEDPDYARLSANQADSARIDGELSALHVKIEKLQQQYDETPAKLPHSDLLTSASNETELQQVVHDLLEANAEVKGIKPANSKYKLIQEKISALELKRDQLSRLVTKGEIQETVVDNPDLAPLRRQIDGLKLDQATLQATYDKLQLAINQGQARVNELQEVYRDVRSRKERTERLASSLEAAEKSYHEKVVQAEMIAGPLANPFEITDQVRAGSKATEPNPWLIVSFGLVAGLGIGLALAVLLEFSKNCFRSVGDISRVMVVPVLGAINTITTRRERRLVTARRLVVGLSSFALIGAIVFVTWAWANNAQLLSQDLRDAIEQLRSKLR